MKTEIEKLKDKISLINGEALRARVDADEKIKAIQMEIMDKIAGKCFKEFRINSLDLDGPKEYTYFKVDAVLGGESILVTGVNPSHPFIVQRETKDFFPCGEEITLEDYERILAETEAKIVIRDRDKELFEIEE